MGYVPNLHECTHTCITFAVMQGMRIGDIYGADAVSRNGSGNPLCVF